MTVGLMLGSGCVAGLIENMGIDVTDQTVSTRDRIDRVSIGYLADCAGEAQEKVDALLDEVNWHGGDTDYEYYRPLLDHKCLGEDLVVEFENGGGSIEALVAYEERAKVLAQEVRAPSHRDWERLTDLARLIRKGL